MNTSEMIITYFRLSEQEKKKDLPVVVAEDLLRTGKFATGYAHIAILQDDGTVTAMGDNAEGQCGVKEWKDIIKVAAGDYHTVGLRKNGTVVAVGNNSHGQCNVDQWHDVSDIFAEKALTVGVGSDGTLLVTEPKKEPPAETLASSADGDIRLLYNVGATSVSISGFRGESPILILEIPDTFRGKPVTEIESRALRNCTAMRIDLPNTLRSIQSYAFASCDNLRSIIIPDGVTAIGSFAFHNCRRLRDVTIPDSVINIGFGAFFGCPEVIIHLSPVARINCYDSLLQKGIEKSAKVQ